MSENRKDAVKVRTVCPLASLLCPCEDGVVATVENGRVVAVEGDREHPVSQGFICPKARHTHEKLYHPQRITQPLLKTAAGWKELPWEEAIDIATDRLAAVRERFGPLSFCSTQCYPGFPESTALTLFTRSLGSPNKTHNLDLCGGTSIAGEMVTYGAVLSYYRSAQDFRNSKCILLVGTNPAHSAGGQWQHIRQAAKNGAKLIVVDPRRSESAKEAHIWLRIRPGTDGALALGMLHVIIKENLYDAAFVNDYCVGFDKLREHVEQYTPEKVAEITSLSPDQITEVARTFATTKPASYRGNNGMTQQTNSTQAARAFAILVAVTGNIDVPGGNLIPTPPPGTDPTMELLQNTRLPAEVEGQRLGATRFPLWCSAASPMAVAHVPTLLNAMITDEPYPVKSMVVFGANPVLTYPDARKVIEALRKLDFLMVIAYTPSPTTELADMVLPTRHPFEQNGFTFTTYGNCLTPAPRVVEPPEGCLDVVDILHRLADKMVEKGHIEKNLIPWKNKDEFVDWRLESMGMSFADLCRQGPTVIERQYRKYEQTGIRSMSGKVELYSSIFEAMGYDPLPVYKEPADSPLSVPKLAEQYPLRLVNRRDYNYYGSRSAEESWLRERLPYPLLQIHPDAARERGLTEGDMVVVETPRGKVQHVAELTEDVPPNLVCATFGWWLPEREAYERSALEANVNAVMSYDPPYDPVLGINSIQNVMCQVCKV